MISDILFIPDPDHSSNSEVKATDPNQNGIISDIVFIPAHSSHSLPNEPTHNVPIIPFHSNHSTRKKNKPTKKNDPMTSDTVILPYHSSHSIKKSSMTRSSTSSRATSSTHRDLDLSIDSFSCSGMEESFQSFADDSDSFADESFADDSFADEDSDAGEANPERATLDIKQVAEELQDVADTLGCLDLNKVTEELKASLEPPSWRRSSITSTASSKSPCGRPPRRNTEMTGNSKLLSYKGKMSLSQSEHGPSKGKLPLSQSEHSPLAASHVSPRRNTEMTGNTNSKLLALDFLGASGLGDSHKGKMPLSQSEHGPSKGKLPLNQSEHSPLAASHVSSKRASTDESIPDRKTLPFYRVTSSGALEKLQDESSRRPSSACKEDTSRDPTTSATTGKTRPPRSERISKSRRSGLTRAESERIPKNKNRRSDLTRLLESERSSKTNKNRRSDLSRAESERSPKNGLSGLSRLLESESNSKTNKSRRSDLSRAESVAERSSKSRSSCLARTEPESNSKNKNRRSGLLRAESERNFPNRRSSLAREASERIFLNPRSSLKKADSEKSSKDHHGRLAKDDGPKLLIHWMDDSTTSPNTSMGDDSEKSSSHTKAISELHHEQPQEECRKGRRKVPNTSMEDDSEKSSSSSHTKTISEDHQEEPQECKKVRRKVRRRASFNGDQTSSRNNSKESGPLRRGRSQRQLITSGSSHKQTQGKNGRSRQHDSRGGRRRIPSDNGHKRRNGGHNAPIQDKLEPLGRGGDNHRRQGRPNLTRTGSDGQLFPKSHQPRRRRRESVSNRGVLRNHELSQTVHTSSVVEELSSDLDLSLRSTSVAEEKKMPAPILRDWNHGADTEEGMMESGKMSSLVRTMGKAAVKVSKRASITAGSAVKAATSTTMNAAKAASKLKVTRTESNTSRTSKLKVARTESNSFRAA